MQKAAFLANWYIGPLKGVRHSQDPKNEDLAHGWHWREKRGLGMHTPGTRQGPALSNPQQAIDHAKRHGFEIYDRPEFNTKFAVIPKKASPPPNGN